MCISHRVKNWYQFFTFGKCEICVWSISLILGVYHLCSNFTSFSFLIVKNWYAFVPYANDWFDSSQMWRIGTQFSQREESVPNAHRCEKLVPIFTDVKNWYLIFTDVNDLVTDFGCTQRVSFSYCLQ